MRKKLPSISSLVTFETVHRLESFTLAGQELSLTQSAVSKKIHALEEYFQQNLFERLPYGLRRTAAADLLRSRLSPCLDELEAALQDVAASRQGGGVLHLAVVPTFASKWLLPRLPELNDRHPDLSVNLRIQLERFDFAGSGLDAAIMFGQPDWPQCEHHLIAEETLVAVCSPAFIKRYGRAKSAREIADSILIHSTSRAYAWPQWLENHGVPVAAQLPGPRFELFSMVAEAAKAGLGIALLPELIVAEEIRRRNLIRLLPAEKQSDGAYYLVYPTRKATLPGLISFRNWLSDILQGKI
jgi:LysR family glycine cleavage system transcriptional activator